MHGHLGPKCRSDHAYVETNGLLNEIAPLLEGNDDDGGEQISDWTVLVAHDPMIILILPMI